MVKFIFDEKSERNFDARIFLFNKTDKRIDSYIKRILGKDELDLVDALIKREGFPSEKKDILEISLKSAKIILAAYDSKKADDLFFQKLGGKVSKNLFTSEIF